MIFEYRQGRRWGLWAILTLGVVLSATVSAGDVVLPDEVFFYYPVASVTGQHAAWVNPAAMGFSNTGSMFIFTQRQKRVFRDWGAVAVMRMLSVAYRRINYDFQTDFEEYIFAAGGGGRTKVGFSYRYIKAADGYLNNRHLWTVGFLLHNSPRLTIGGRAENLNRGRIDGERSEIRFVYGIAADLYRNMVTATFEVDMISGESLTNADFRTGIEVRPVPGAYVYLDFDNHWRINLGFRLNFGSSYVGHYHNFDRDFKSTMGTSYLGSVSHRQPSFEVPWKIGGSGSHSDR